MEALAVQPSVSLKDRPRISPSPDRKRFLSSGSDSSASLILDAEGNICEMSAPARHLLEYRSEQDADACFFSHVHGRNLYQVMRDVADMVCYGKAAASWLLRMRTGRGRWRWFKASVKNRLNTPDGTIIVSLRDMNEW